MASAKTKTFEITALIQADTTADNQPLDLTDYVDVADNEVFMIEEWDVMLDPTEAFPALADCRFQIADTNIAAFVSLNDRTSVGVARIGYDGATLSTNKVLSMSSDTNYGENLIVSRTLWVRNESSAGTLDHTLTIRGKIVKPTAKEYMALVLTQTGQVAV